MNSIKDNLLDLSLLQAAERHPFVFIRYDELEPGETFVLCNDHDPKPLYYQLLGSRGNRFSWQYLQSGPAIWKIAITKRNEQQPDETLGEIAASDMRKAAIFQKYGLDFCCGGKRTLKEACEEKGLDQKEIEDEFLKAELSNDTPNLFYEQWDLSFLADYIVNTHHSYVRRTMPDIIAYSLKVATAHGDNHPELYAIRRLLQEVNTELTSHMIKEEKVLFPFIKALEASATTLGNGYHAGLGTIGNPINMMEMEHELAGNKMKEILSLSDNYRVPEDVCASYQLLYKMIAEFEKDLHTHIHLENNVLFPKAMKLEKNVVNQISNN